LLIACDVYRPAAIDQLHVLGEQIGVDVFSEREEQKSYYPLLKLLLSKQKKMATAVVINRYRWSFSS
jgi:signal recognition particle subunit SRP54